jgi:hypothetical protein
MEVSAAHSIAPAVRILFGPTWPPPPGIWPSLHLPTTFIAEVVRRYLSFDDLVPVSIIVTVETCDNFTYR